MRTWERSYLVANTTVDLYRLGDRWFRLVDAGGITICEPPRMPSEAEVADHLAVRDR